MTHNNERDDEQIIERLLVEHVNWVDSYPGSAAQAILTHFQRRPRQVTTVEDAEPLYRELSKHHPTRGIAVAMGVTCECGYWTGDEQPGKTRPVGIRGDQLDWHRTQVAINFLDTHVGSL